MGYKEAVKTEDREAIEILLTRKAAYLTDWERDCLHSLQRQPTWSVKQQAILETLWDEIMSGRREA